MKKVSLKPLFPLTVLILLTILLNQQIGSLPPLGKFFNPFRGVVQNECLEEVDKKLHFEDRDFEIIFDVRNVPHIFADNEDDMHFSQGYVTASDRLWQMDFLSDAAAGKLASILGKDYLIYDRFQRRSGMLQSAKKSLKFIESDSRTRAALNNYTEGVNAYINQLSEAEYPLEYKLLGYKPKPWTNLKSVLIMKYMGSNLNGYEEDAANSYQKLILGDKDFNKLYPDIKIEDVSTGKIVRLMEDLPHSDSIDYSFLKKTPKIGKSTFNPRYGSNAWAISKDKSATGNPILCNDPHLSLSAPAIWYEIQLKSDKRNVMGYSIPGTPGVIIGFNDEISWGITAGSTDVRDWYKLDLVNDYSGYKDGDKWKETTMVVEKIEIQGTKPFYDTVYYTGYGPIVSDDSIDGMQESKDLTLRWALHEESNEFLSIILINQSSNRSEFERAIKYFCFPVVNFIYADKGGNIGFNHQGRIFRRTEHGIGKFIINGSNKLPATRYISSSELPSELNPKRRYVYSANNNPWTDSSSLYVNGYYSELRAAKIQLFLNRDKKFTIQDMKEMQLDNTNVLAELAMPVLLDLLTEKDEFLQKMKGWNYKCEEGSKEAVFFDMWWKSIISFTWEELLRYDQFSVPPNDLVLLDLLKNEPNYKFFDLIHTSRVEDASDIVNIAYKNAGTHFKDDIKKGWKGYNQVNLVHLSKVDAFGKIGFSSNGNPDALNAISQNWGPSMRLIVELGKNPKAWGVIAGGTSGNPASPYYRSNVNAWLKGEYYELNYFKSVQDTKRKKKFIWKSK